MLEQKWEYNILALFFFFFLPPLPTSHFDGLMITSIVTENATEIVHPAMIAIFRHCHALVSTNPILWSILNFCTFCLEDGF